MAEDKKKLTPFEQELEETKKKVTEFRTAAEASVVAILYKSPEELFNVNLTLDDFAINVWKVYFEIISKLVIQERKKTIDEVTVGLYLEQHSKLKEMYDKYGGFDTIEKAKAYVHVENLSGFISELRKWKAVLNLCELGFSVKDRLSEFKDMTAEEIYNEFEALLNSTFVNVDSDVKCYDISYKLEELIDELDEGLAVGLPYYNMEMITNETGGMYKGSITLVGGLSNVGKSTFARTAIIPTVIDKQEPIVIMLNEDSIEKWQRELIVFVANNRLGYDIQKHVVRKGDYSQDTRNKLLEAVDYIKKLTKDNLITVIPFQNFSTEKVIKVIRKFSSMGVSQFLVDTYKLDTGKVSNNSWLEMQQNMVAINDAIKPETNNVHIMLTFQLAKGSANQRYYTQDNIGVSKNIIDPASTCLMIRNVYDDEKEKGKNALEVWKPETLGKKGKVQVTLEKDKHYQIVFIIKNREGSANQYQVVLEHDMSRNILKEVGWCNVPIDF